MAIRQLYEGKFGNGGKATRKTVIKWASPSWIVVSAMLQFTHCLKTSLETPLCDWSATPVLLEPLRRSEFDTSDDHYQFATFDCSRCHRQYSSMKSLRRHVFHCGKVVRSALGHTGRIQYFDENGDQRQFVCTYCSKAYRWKKGLKVHQIRCEAKLEQDRRDGRVPEEATEKAIEKATEKATVKATEKATEKYPLETPRAPPEFTNLNIPPVIIKNSTSGRFQCILCRKRYNWLKNLKRHQVVCRQKMLTKQRWKDCKVMLEPLSSESKPNVSAQNFKCVNCGREYRWLKAFKQHQTNCEPKERGNQWNISDTSGTQYDNVIVNVDDVDTDEEVDVVDVKVDVEILDVEEFQSETNLISNQEVKKPSKTQKGLKQDGSGDSYKCALCGNEYKWKKNWKRHYLKCSVGGRHAGAEVGKRQFGLKAECTIRQQLDLRKLMKNLTTNFKGNFNALYVENFING
ncbi:zinc finger protein 208-like [Belonocnema kinseyi]|uniref:zinc finger protein 208-like n=1 Tax=Belonocnema kinseyi TaxID=2817044 RepID=UPI00143D5DE7|nr:zinc finger protein 208-like [Belonocnema kinseyi]